MFGLRADVPSATLTWDVRLTEAFGVRGYPFGSGEGVLDLECGPRPRADQQPIVAITSSLDRPITLRLTWGKTASTLGGVPVDRSTVAGTSRVVRVPPGETVVVFADDSA